MNIAYDVEFDLEAFLESLEPAGWRRRANGSGRRDERRPAPSGEQVQPLRSRTAEEARERR